MADPAATAGGSHNPPDRTELPAGWIVAPDGIPVRPIVLADDGLIGLAEGLIPPGDFAIHMHYSLEQVTHLLEGELKVRMGSPPEEIQLGPGEAIRTAPGRSLSFHNHGSAPARVLFICAPPYPADSSDTATLAAHGPARGEHVSLAEMRQREALAAIAGLYERHRARTMSAK